MRLINADDAKRYIWREWMSSRSVDKKELCDIFEMIIVRCCEHIDNTPTVDAVEVVHGKWVMVKPRRIGRNATYKCTVCNRLRSSYYNDVQEWKYCPCGAKMDLK